MFPVVPMATLMWSRTKAKSRDIVYPTSRLITSVSSSCSLIGMDGWGSGPVRDSPCSRRFWPRDQSIQAGPALGPGRTRSGNGGTLGCLWAERTSRVRDGYQQVSDCFGVDSPGSLAARETRELPRNRVGSWGAMARDF